VHLQLLKLIGPHRGGGQCLWICITSVLQIGSERDYITSVSAPGRDGGHFTGGRMRIHNLITQLH